MNTTYLLQGQYKSTCHIVSASFNMLTLSYLWLFAINLNVLPQITKPCLLMLVMEEKFIK